MCERAARFPFRTSCRSDTLTRIVDPDATRPIVDRMRVHLWAILLLVGCGNAAEERAKLAELEKKADQRVAQAEKSGREKVDSLQKELDQIKAELATSKSKLDEATKAQASSEDAAKQLEAALLKARQAYKAEGKAKLAAVNK